MQRLRSPQLNNGISNLGPRPQSRPPLKALLLSNLKVLCHVAQFLSDFSREVHEKYKVKNEKKKNEKKKRFLFSHKTHMAVLENLKVILELGSASGETRNLQSRKCLP